MDYRGDRGVYFPGKRGLRILGGAVLELGDARIEAGRLDYDPGSGRVTSPGGWTAGRRAGREVRLRGERAAAWPSRREFRYEGGVSGKLRDGRGREMAFGAERIDLDAGRGRIWPGGGRGSENGGLRSPGGGRRSSSSREAKSSSISPFMTM